MSAQEPIPTGDDGAPPAVPSRPRASTALVVLATLAVGYTLWAAQGVILPVLLAMFFSLVGNPVIRALRRLRFPRFLAALLVACTSMPAPEVRRDARMPVPVIQVDGVARAFKGRGSDSVHSAREQAE